MEHPPSIFAGRVARRGTVFYGPAPLDAAATELFGWSGVFAVVAVLPPSRRPTGDLADPYDDLYIGEAADVGRALAGELDRACWEREAGGRTLLVFFQPVEGDAGAAAARRQLAAECLRAGLPPCNRPH